MHIKIVCIGKTDQREIEALMGQYTERLQHYVKTEWIFIPDPKNRKTLSKEMQMAWEADQISSHIKNNDLAILLDEKGKTFSSVGLSEFINKTMVAGYKHAVFVIGGPYGISASLKSKYPQCISLSSLTFSHQMVRLFLVELLYRAMTILNNEPYHHE